MIPNSDINAVLEVAEAVEVSKTYKLSENKIQGNTDELEALQQAIYKVLGTEMYENPIYGFSYGIELVSLVGKNSTYVKIEMKRRIQECLMKDSRIKSVDDFEFITNADEILCTFKVVSIYGDLSISKEVNA